ncbi:MAG: hypothetical protein HQM10_02760 [Candidatus Riflebacteria bacterium]|nr:hypothetical protein [Candidatus Riflebacteria bacterium]
MKHILLIDDRKCVSFQMLSLIFKRLEKAGFTFEPVDSRQWQNILPSMLNTVLPIFVKSSTSINLRIMNHLISSNIDYLFYIDDDLWNMSKLGIYSGDLEILNTLIKNARTTIVPSLALLEIVKKINKNAIFIKPMFDFDLLDGCVKQKHDEEMRISFPSNREIDLRFLYPVIYEIAKKYQGRVFFELFFEVPEWVNKNGGIRYLMRFPDYSFFMKFQYSRNWDIGLAPLEKLSVHNSKTNLKYREYGACETAGIYQNHPIYTKYVKDGYNGLIADSTEESWYNSLVTLIENAELRKKITCNAFFDVKETFSLESVIPDWLDFLNSIP